LRDLSFTAEDTPYGPKSREMLAAALQRITLAGMDLEEDDLEEE
jgi:hypothetical protein